MEPNTENTALLVMDMQTAILANLPDAKKVVDKVRLAIDKAHVRKIPVVYIVVGFRQGAPEASLKNKGFAANRERFANANMEEFIKIHPELAPIPGELTVVKRRVSAFTGSDLEVVLRSLGIQHMVLTGIATSGVVLSTVREAADKDYRITVLSDGCADADEEIHRVLTTKVFPRQTEVLTVDQWSQS
jgi:nicotinamidase-related amidase